MHVSFGWIFLLGGIAGTVTVLRARSVADLENWPNSEAKKSRTPMSRRVRLLVLVLNLLLAVGGAAVIQKQHNWNPFAPCPSCVRNDDGVVS